MNLEANKALVGLSFSVATARPGRHSFRISVAGFLPLHFTPTIHCHFFAGGIEFRLRRRYSGGPKSVAWIASASIRKIPPASEITFKVQSDLRSKTIAASKS